MTPFREWLVRLRDTWRPRRTDADLEAELRSHLYLAQERAASPSRAQLAPAMESLRDQRGLPAVDGLVRDVRQGVRALRRSPTFTLVAVATLAVAIAAATTVFTMVDTVLLQPLSYPEPDRLVAVWQTAPGAPGLAAVSGELRLSDSMYFTYAEQNRVFDALGVWGTGRVAVTGSGDPEEVRGVAVSDGVLQALGVGPLLGRTLTASDQMSGAPRVLLLSYGYWMRRFGGDPAVVGRALTVDGTPRRVVGVMPRGFTIAGDEVDIIGPARFDRSHAALPGFGWQGVARLKPGVTVAQADADIARLVPIWMMSWPAFGGVDPHVYETWRITPALRPLKDDIVGDVAPALWVLMAAVGFVLLIACAFVATLVLVRTDERQHELAIRTALGASRRRILRALAIEALLLTTAAAAIASGVSAVAVRMLVLLAPFQLPRASEMAIGPHELMFAAVVALVAALGIGVIPAMRRSAVADALHTAGRTSTETPGRQRARNALIVVQLAMAVVLLVSSGLMLRSFSALHAVDPGFTNANEQLTIRMSIPEVLVPSPEQVFQAQHALVDRLRAIPGVTSAALGSQVPMEGEEPDWDVVMKEGQPLTSKDVPPLRFFNSVSPGFFATMGTRLVAGREFTWGDLQARPRAVLVSENLAREFWGSAPAAIGQHILTLPSAPLQEVIGVVQDVRANGVQQPAPTIVYWPSYGESHYRAGVATVERTFTVVMRTPRAGVEGLLGEVRRAVNSTNPSIALASVRTLQDIYDRSMARTAFTMRTLLLAGAMALALGIIGVYGVVSYSVSRRRREIGIRLALGGQPRTLVRGFVRWGLLLSAAAIPIGLVLSAGVTRLMRSLLYGVTPLDPTTYVVVVIVLGAAAAMASYLPARQIVGIDPMRTLNAE
ncbi:MAG: ABC transporter permease [Vicinamibacterales bacterium]